MGYVDLARAEQQRRQCRLHLARPLAGQRGVEDALVRGTVRIPEDGSGLEPRAAGSTSLIEQLGQGQATGDVPAAVATQAVGDGEQEALAGLPVVDCPDRPPGLAAGRLVGDEVSPAAQQDPADLRSETTPAEVVFVALADRSRR
jgi:hypothetical protein